MRQADPSWAALVLPAVVAGVAMVLFLWGRRGRVMGDHPHCRKCGFDLFGTLSQRCGECGSDLTRPRAVVAAGDRRRRSGLTAAAAVVLMLVAVAWGGARAAGWFDRKPDWLLRIEIGLDGRRPAALDELSARMRWRSDRAWVQGPGAQPHTIAEPSVRRLLSAAGNAADFDDHCRDFLLDTWHHLRRPARRDAAAALVPLLDVDDLPVAVRAARVLRRAAEYRSDIDPELRRAAALMIERQGDRARPWESELGAVVEDARRAGLVDDAAWTRFGRQMVHPQLYARRRVRAGDGLPFGIGWVKPRTGLDLISLNERWDACEVGGLELMGEYRTEFVLSSHMTDSEDVVVSPYSGAGRELPVGRHVLRAAITFRVVELDPATVEEAGVRAEWRTEWTLPVEVVPAGSDVVRAVAAPGLPEAFGETAAIRAWMKNGTVWITGDVGPLPTTVAARALVEEPSTGRRWDVRQEVIRGGHRQRLVIALDTPLRWPDQRLSAGAVINVILKPDPAAARQTIDVVDYADVPLRIEGLQIKAE